MENYVLNFMATRAILVVSDLNSISVAQYRTYLRQQRYSRPSSCDTVENYDSNNNEWHIGCNVDKLTIDEFSNCAY